MDPRLPHQCWRSGPSARLITLQPRLSAHRQGWDSRAGKENALTGRARSFSDAAGQRRATLRSLLGISAHVAKHGCGLPQPAGDSLHPSGLPGAQLMKGNWVSAAIISATASV